MWEVYWGVLGEWYLVTCNSKEEALELQDDLLGYTGYVNIEVLVQPSQQQPFYPDKYSRLFLPL